MKPADRLIVALDVSAERADDLITRLVQEAGVSFFKVSPSLLLDHHGYGVAERAALHGLFLDLKTYDTRDSVARIVGQAFDLGARFVTVHATPSVMEAAMRAKPNDERCKVLAVPVLSDSTLTDVQRIAHKVALAVCDGIICSAATVEYFRHPNNFGSGREVAKGKLLVCPGIRRLIEYKWEREDNHHSGNLATPTEALRAGADYLVIGRPIVAAPDPVAAARAIIAEMEAAEDRVPHGTNSA